MFSLPPGPDGFLLLLEDSFDFSGAFSLLFLWALQSYGQYVYAAQLGFLCMNYGIFYKFSPCGKCPRSLLPHQECECSEDRNYVNISLCPHSALYRALAWRLTDPLVQSWKDIWRPLRSMSQARPLSMPILHGVQRTFTSPSSVCSLDSPWFSRLPVTQHLVCNCRWHGEGWPSSSANFPLCPHKEHHQAM